MCKPARQRVPRRASAAADGALRSHYMREYDARNGARRLAVALSCTAEHQTLHNAAPAAACVGVKRWRPARALAPWPAPVAQLPATSATTYTRNTQVACSPHSLNNGTARQGPPLRLLLLLLRPRNASTSATRRRAPADAALGATLRNTIARPRSAFESGLPYLALGPSSPQSQARSLPQLPGRVAARTMSASAAAHAAVGVFELLSPRGRDPLAACVVSPLVRPPAAGSPAADNGGHTPVRRAYEPDVKGCVADTSRPGWLTAERGASGFYCHSA
jgi:hypothetical protein